MTKAENEKSPERRYHHGDLRRALIEAAEHELAEKGFEGFTLRGCAKRAGVSHAAPAYHFKDADALLSALAAEGFVRFTADMAARQEAAASARARDRLIAAGLGYLDFALKHPALLRLMFASERPHQELPELQEAAQRAFHLLEHSVEALHAEKPERKGVFEHDVAATWSIVHGLAELTISGRLDFIAELATERRDEVAAAIIGRAIPQ